MKKYYCFYCQKDMEPRHFLKWRFCPQCHRYMIDKGEGFYRICDNCGANMPVDAAECCQCKHPTGLPTTKLPPMSLWLNWLARMALITIGLIFILAVLYFSFYLITAIVIAFLIIGFTLFLSDQFLHRR